MQNPQRDLPVVLTGLATSHNPADLRAAVKKFYTPDASLHHPFRIVEHGANSRQKILGMYEWCRIISPNTTSDVDVVFYNGKHHVLVRLSPFKSAPSRYIIRIKLQERDKLFYIYSQEEFLHPMFCRPLTPLVRLALVFFALMEGHVLEDMGLSLLLWAKLFGIGSDIQRGKGQIGLNEVGAT
ncbi:hypothetical protein DFJ58DRAFT_878732 [Suillus subalutaceus]|uniref:uncharacterized protein n=1 Tax=Suillus subalutaceus TaxID=48586 RepID=UPI001B886406|nr:uncharacterized protein DFJ58DRAFT_878732 [Suillus subalutaceus]KAG1856973.1 hypothetical protein DFJ58DRAFT_878732 [Suillus subalutaceus]